MNITAEFSAALARAGARLRGVEHDAQNKYHGYKYTSSEAMVAAARDVLSAEGLAMVVTSWTLTVRALPDGGGVVRTLPDGNSQKMAGAAEVVGTMTALLFGHGGCIEIQREQPVIPEKGRPMDKAAAGADTQCLSYILRGALLIDRPDENDVDKRDDTPPPPQRPERRSDKTPQKPGAKVETRAALESLATMIDTDDPNWPMGQMGPPPQASAPTQTAAKGQAQSRTQAPGQAPAKPSPLPPEMLEGMRKLLALRGKEEAGALWDAFDLPRKIEGPAHPLYLDVMRELLTQAAEPSTPTKVLLGVGWRGVPEVETHMQRLGEQPSLAALVDAVKSESPSPAPRVPSRRVYETQAEQDTLGRLDRLAEDVPL